jgi:Lon protease-like protein
MSDVLIPGLDEPVPLFPLPNLVMFPRAVQFLHMFEGRYRTMMRDVLKRPVDRRFIAMGLLKPGYQPLYHTNHAEIHDTVCVGLVVRHERLTNGTYNLILRGLCRAAVMEENRHGPYRLARLEPVLGSMSEAGFDARTARKQLARLLREPSFDGLDEADLCRRWFESDLGLGDLVDLVSFYLLPDDETELKQLLLEKRDLPGRVELLTTAVASLARVLQADRSRRGKWPPPLSAN